MSELSDDLMRKLLASFQVEAVEHLDTLNQSILELERSEDSKQRKTLIQDAFRAAHSLKGAARAVDLGDIESLAHGLESVLQQSRKSNVPPSAEVCDVMYEILDGIKDLLDGKDIDATQLGERLFAVSDVAETEAESTLDEPTAEPPENNEVQDSSDQKQADNGFRAISDDTIRVAVSKLDTLMAQSGELVVSKISAEQRLTELQLVRQQFSQSHRTWREIQGITDHLNGSGMRLRELLELHFDRMQLVSRLLDGLEQDFHNDIIRLGMMVDDLQVDVRRVRMLPFHTITLGLERAVRDAARVEGKTIAFSIDGSNVDLDKKILETLKDPLLHLLRNAVSHGIETASEREKAGKPTVGQITLTIRQRGGEIGLIVRDDGRGFDFDRLRKAGGIAQDSSFDDSLSVAFMPGVTTSNKVSSISGRGVGLDVVRQRIEDIHGRIAVETSPGEGTAIELIVPTSLAITRSLIIKAGEEHFALPLLSIERIIEVTDIFSISGKQMVRVNETPLALVSLASILGRSNQETSERSSVVAVIISVAEQKLALQIDHIETELELAVKPIGDPLVRVQNIAGAALLGSGQPIVVLNPADLIRSARGISVSNILVNKPELDEQQPVSQILVVDDSITTRTLEKNILEAAGYHVITAVNGVEAMKCLDEYEIDLVVTDIEMPRMNGFELTRQIRDHADHGHLPVILVTSLESKEDREQGMMAGADAYIVKSGFNQANLLQIIAQYLDDME